MNTLIFLAGCTAEAIALQLGTTIALVAQQIFGIITAVIGLGTLFALTPLGSLVFKDGNVQRLPRPTDHVQGTAVHNPLQNDKKIKARRARAMSSSGESSESETESES